MVARPRFLERLVPRLVHAFAPRRIALFGSYAKGTQGAASDVDLLIVCDLPADSPQAMRRARQLAADCFPSVDIVFASPQDVERAATAASPFLNSILAGSVTLYEAGFEHASQSPSE